MITITYEDLTTKQDTDFRRWLGGADRVLLEKIVKGKLQQAQVTASNEILEAKDGNSNYFESANITLLKAFKYKQFLEVLEEIVALPPDQNHKLTHLK